MIKKIKRLYKWFKAKIDKSPVRYMVIGYLLLWLCLCLVLTVCLGRRHMEDAAQEKGTLLGNVFQDIMREFEEEAHKPDFHFEDNKDFLNYKLLMLRDRLDSIPCSEEPYGVFQVQLRDLSRVDVWLSTDQPEAESTIVDLTAETPAILRPLSQRWLRASEAISEKICRSSASRPAQKLAL